MGLIKKVLKIIRLKMNKKDIFFYKGKIILGENVKFNQRLILKKDEKVKGGKITIGNNCSFGYEYGGGFNDSKIEIQIRGIGAEIKISNNVATNNNLFICAKKLVEIENDCLIGRNVTIMDHNAHGISPNKRRTSSGTAKEIKIEENVWIGNNVIILPGTKIGKNSIVGAGSVLKGVYPKNVIIQGNPAKIIKNIEEI